MLDLLKVRLEQGRRTVPFPSEQVQLPERFRGRPVVDAERCEGGCTACVDVCPTQAVETVPLHVDLGACLFCGLCAAACPDDTIRFTPDYRMATSRRDDLMVDSEGMRLAQALDEKTRKLFGRSLKLRQVSAGGCSGCEAELTALGNVVFDLSRFGIQFVASPRHADGIVVTGPVTLNMAAALRETYQAVPSPRLVIAVGACAISGGPFAGADACHSGIPDDIPVDLYVPGCPPHPYTIIDGLLRLLGRVSNGGTSAV